MDLQATVLLLIIFDPIGNAPVFSSILRDIPAPKARRVILRESLIALCVLVGVLVAGAPVMTFLGLSSPALGLAGGIILFLIALRMIFPVQGGIFGETESGTDRIPLAVPLAVPLIAGPSAMATIMLFAAQAGSPLPLVLPVLVAWAISTLILCVAPELRRWCGDRVLSAGQRLLGMLLVIISVQQCLDGIRSAVRL